jgi:hypothetical protein
MPKHLCLILGNGFTLDLLHSIGLSDKIDVQNLFRFGAEVPWPATGAPGFLSFKHCPNLWNLGARAHCRPDECMSLIEDIITCVNAFASKPASKKPPAGPSKPNDIYLFAYKELSAYLRSLFVWYNQQFPDIPDTAADWSWAKFIKWASTSNEYDRITIVTYNYDVWLERVLLKLGISFQLGLLHPPSPTTRITILKPHGSISFCHKTVRDKAAFTILLNRDLLDGDLPDFEVKYANLDENYLVNPIIPPAGEAGRLNRTWAGKIRAACRTAAADLKQTDEMIISGLSYWHVDRAELDEILNGCEPSLNLRLINPNPTRTFIAVLTSIFENFVAFTSSRALEQYIK